MISLSAMLLPQCYYHKLKSPFLSISPFEEVIKVQIYPMDFKMHRDGKGANPREHRELCDRGE